MKLLLLFVSLVCIARASSDVVAAVIIHEAGGEGDRGMIAVANVIANRSIKKTPYEVVTRRHQFECITRYLSNQDAFVARAKKHPRWAFARKLVDQINARTLQDITGGATHFHNLSMVPSWAKKITFKIQIGGHKFYREG